MATREELKALMEAQQKQFSDLLNALVSKNAAPVANNSELYAQINGQIPDFRFGDFVLKDGQALSEDMKDLFSDIKSRFVRQFECFQLCCAPAQSVLDFGATVNAKCERADMNLSKEEIKCMIFVSGLGDSHRDLRHECLRQMEKSRSATPPRTIKLETLLEECRAILSLQSSAAALGNPGQVHAIQSKATGLRDRPTGSVRVAEEDTSHRTVPIRLEFNAVIAAKLATFDPFVRPVAPIFSPGCSPMPSSPRSVWYTRVENGSWCPFK
uniref:Uncharacterized protein n=1 Tax=Globodera rostochiensis TaxID=31243 RepID=A0A914HMX3_GLORO